MFCRLLLFSAILMAGNGVAHADLVSIDTFDVGPHSVTADASNGNVSDSLSGLDPLQVLDGRRQLTIQGAMSSGSITATVETNGAGTLDFSSNNPVYTNQFDGRLLITHVAGNRFSTYDLSSFSNHYYRIDVVSADLGSAGASMDATFRISSPTGTGSTTFTLLDSDTPYQIAIPMSSLTGVDLSRSFNMQLDIGQLPSDSSFAFDRVYFSSSAVPEPTALFSTMILLSLMIAGIWLARIRRARQAQGHSG